MSVNPAGFLDMGARFVADEALIAARVTWDLMATEMASMSATMASALSGKSDVGHTHAWSTVTGKPSFAAVATSGDYNDLSNKPASTVARSFAAPSRALVSSTSATGFQVSSTRDAYVSYEGTFSTTSTIGGAAAITVYLETADTNSTTPGDWTAVASQTNSNTITLAIALQQVDVEPWVLGRLIPAGKYVRLRYGGVSGTASASINAAQQEVLL